ncbi:PREDICTED: UPF0472 protein C16orf72 homolog [Condylura cristata]|uniref:UPF0472 protein C16orf72 homolog n=1 Tax=Condylura cristata TaxID=143302 RepID=UPI000642F412|nr:PREDICTED: UPF0472 protein C16orf72 homolog [Condylura cristata]
MRAWSKTGPMRLPITSRGAFAEEVAARVYCPRDRASSTTGSSRTQPCQQLSQTRCVHLQSPPHVPKVPPSPLTHIIFIASCPPHPQSDCLSGAKGNRLRLVWTLLSPSTATKTTKLLSVTGAENEDTSGVRLLSTEAAGGGGAPRSFPHPRPAAGGTTDPRPPVAPAQFPPPPPPAHRLALATFLPLPSKRPGGWLVRALPEPRGLSTTVRASCGAEAVEHCSLFFSLCLSLWLSLCLLLPRPLPRADRVCQQPGLSLWVPFQNAATAVTNLYKESVDTHQRSFDIGIQIGYQRRNKDVLAWVKKRRRTIRREDLISFLCGKVPPPRNSRAPPRLTVVSPNRATSTETSSSVETDLQPFREAIALHGLSGAMASISVRSSAPGSPTHVSSGPNASRRRNGLHDVDLNTFISEEMALHLDNGGTRKRTSAQCGDVITDSPTHKRNRMI